MFVALGCLVPSTVVDAFEVLRLTPGSCIEALEGAPANGIATGELLADPVVRLCDGSRHRVALRNGRLTLGSDLKNLSPEPLVPDLDPLMLPDGETTHGGGRIVRAWLIGPSEIYRHGILGDAIEASGLHLRLADGGRRELFLDQGSVFEDLRVRLVDLNGDGQDEMVAIRSYLDRGAALAVYALGAGGLRQLGESPAIGLPNRWLNPAGAGDFDDDGEREIALVETPHIGGTLKIFALREEGLVLEYSATGFSNHAIGSRLLDLSTVVDWDNDGVADIALPDSSRQALTVVAVKQGRIETLVTQRHPDEISTAVRATDLDGDGRPEILYGVRGKGLVLLRP